jgi:hypothetical protein
MTRKVQLYTRQENILPWKHAFAAANPSVNTTFPLFTHPSPSL